MPATWRPMSPHPGEVGQRVPARLPGAAHAEDGRVHRRPRPRRIPDQQCTATLAIPRRGQEARAAHVPTRLRRHADEIDVGAAIEREQARALAVRADDVVVRELVAVGARTRDADVRNRLARERGPRGVGPVLRQRPDEANQLRVVQSVDDEALIGWVHRQRFEQLLVGHELGAQPIQPLHHEVEPRRHPLDTVVVDRHTEQLAPARLAGLEAQKLAAGRDVDGGAQRTIRDADDDGRLATVQEVVLYRERHEAQRGMPAEDAAVVFEAADGNGFVQRPSFRPANERDDSGCDERYDFLAVVAFGRLRREVERFGRHSARGLEKPILARSVLGCSRYVPLRAHPRGRRRSRRNTRTRKTPATKPPTCAANATPPPEPGGAASELNSCPTNHRPRTTSAGTRTV
jgi:hypothetical protein